jgi:hypothetical protein
MRSHTFITMRSHHDFHDVSLAVMRVTHHLAFQHESPATMDASPHKKSRRRSRYEGRDRIPCRDPLSSMRRARAHTKRLAGSSLRI